MARETTDASFQTDVLNNQKTVLVDFWAPWCGPCHMLSPIIEEIGNELSDKVEVYKMNVDQNPETATRFGIQAIPTVIIFKGGEMQKSMVGVQSKDVYVNALK